MILGLKIAITDIKYQKIKNRDLLMIFALLIFQHQVHQIRFALCVLLAGLVISRFMGAGDIKFLSLIVLSKPDLPSTFKSFEYISFLLLTILVIFLISHRNLRGRAPIAPALCVGLFI
jgi:Flp pilus assembly protein protease CpaA